MAPAPRILRSCRRKGRGEELGAWVDGGTRKEKGPPLEPGERALKGGMDEGCTGTRRAAWRGVGVVVDGMEAMREVKGSTPGGTGVKISVEARTGGGTAVGVELQGKRGKGTEDIATIPLVLRGLAHGPVVVTPKNKAGERTTLAFFPRSRK